MRFFARLISMVFPAASLFLCLLLGGCSAGPDAVVDTDTGEQMDAHLFVADAAIQRLRLHRGFSGHGVEGLDH